MENKCVLVTGSNGFIGKNLVERLKNIGLTNIMCYDINSTDADLCEYTARADFVFHLAGINRPKNQDEFYKGNAELTENIINLLKQSPKKPSLLITSSAQATLDNDYGKSKKMAEDAVRAYNAESGANCYIYRLPGVFGKWCRPAYNSVVATYCHNVANNLPIEVRDQNYTFPLVYIDDVVDSFVNALNGNMPAGDCCVPVTHEISLGRLASLITSFKQTRQTLQTPDMSDSFVNKLYATYLSYLPKNEFAYELKMNADDRGSFTEFLRTDNAGQVSVNISKPHIVKGNHWHDTKNEKFLVVKGEGVIRFRQIHSDEIVEYKVSGDKLTVVDIPTGYTHNIENTGETEMVTVMWANEPFNKDKPDTYFLKV